jgi:release factor glutamine methyltransferase
LPGKKTTVRQALSDATAELAKAGITDALPEAEYLLTHILGCKRHALFLDPDRALTGDESVRFEGYLERRIKREPSQYITGEVDFRGCPIKVTRATLIPRPETELLVDEALKAASPLKKDAVILDLCTGSGCIAISAALEIKGSRVYATDISEAALAVAKENASINNAGSLIEFYKGDLFTALPGALKGVFDMILSNPPYVPDSDRSGLAPEVREFEPEAALFGGKDGLDVIERIIEGAPEYLKKGGALIMEIGYDQSEKVKGLVLKDRRYLDAMVRKDYSGIERILVARVKR